MNAEQIEMLKRLKAPIDKYMGEIEIGDMFYNPFRKKLCFVDKETIIIEGCSVIPPLCTPDGKRCLWGMVDWKVWNFENMPSDGNVLIFQKMSRGGVEFRDADPYTALLKALCSQKGL